MLTVYHRKPRSGRLDPMDPFIDATNSRAPRRGQGSSRAQRGHEPELELSDDEKVTEPPTESDNDSELEEEPLRRRKQAIPNKQNKARDVMKMNGRKIPTRRSAAPAPDVDSSSEP